jgi:ubiquinone/menaquinone biosynthesis C-methylase UbiE
MKPEYASTSKAFDYIAADYDSIYCPESNIAMAWMRRESLALLRNTFPRGSRLLELGCGTGEEAIYLAKTGCEIIATDISPKMASITLQKVLDQKLDHRIQIAVLPAGMLDKLQPPLLFDGAYASFGVLNCEPDLPAVGKALAQLIRPGGLFLTSVMGQTCLFEIAWYLLNLQPGKAFRRLQKGGILLQLQEMKGVKLLFRPAILHPAR